MNYAKGIEPLSALESRSAELVQTARDTGNPVLLTEEGRPTAVLQDVDSFQRQRDTLALLKLVVQGENDYRRGDVLSHSEADSHFRRKLADLKSSD